MAKASKERVIGLEINDTQLNLVVLQKHGSTPKVIQIHTAQLPPRTVIEGQITDPEALSEHIFKCFSDCNLKGGNVLASINDFQFIKRVERMPSMPYEDTKAEVEIRVGNAAFLHEEEFQSGFIKPDAPSLNLSLNPPVLYVGIQKRKIDVLKGLIESNGFVVSSIDLLPLATIRPLLLNLT